VTEDMKNNGTLNVENQKAQEGCINSPCEAAKNARWVLHKRHFLDAGTTWSKILTVDNGEKSYQIIKTADLKDLKLNFSAATGHSASLKNVEKYENEVVALASGAKEYLNECEIILDMGSRDIKRVNFKGGKFSDMDWNTNCASATGATIEMLLKFYNVDIKELIPTDEKYPVTCGIFGLEKIMDDVAKGILPSCAISKFIAGIAFSAWNFAKNPDKLALSGGFCENPCFVKSLSKYCEVKLLGRFVLTDGLYALCS